MWLVCPGGFRPTLSLADARFFDTTVLHRQVDLGLDTAKPNCARSSKYPDAVPPDDASERQEHSGTMVPPEQNLHPDSSSWRDYS